MRNLNNKIIPIGDPPSSVAQRFYLVLAGLYKKYGRQCSKAATTRSLKPRG